jgi:hypothetical protein
MELLGVPENYALVLGAHLRTPPAAFAPQERGAVLANATDVYLLGFVMIESSESVSPLGENASGMPGA